VSSVYRLVLIASRNEGGPAGPRLVSHLPVAAGRGQSTLLRREPLRLPVQVRYISLSLFLSYV
jgi:hypothetical protein